MRTTLGLRRLLAGLVNRTASPDRVAAGIALGVCIGMTPLVGLQTPIVLAAASALRLSKTDTWMATYVMNPWTIVPILTFEHWLGRRIVGLSGDTGVRWSELFRGSFVSAFRDLALRDAHALLVGGCVAAMVTGLVAFALARQFLHICSTLRRAADRVA